MPLPDDLSTILDRLENNEQTEADIAALRQLLSADDAASEGLRQRQIALQLGKYNVNIGQGQDIQIGDRIYVEWNDEAIQALIQVVRKQLPTPATGIPENLPRSGVVQFVGRERELETLHHQLQENERVAVSAIAGMGGVGKTELALQYALRYKPTYQGGICWLQARGVDIGTQIVQFGRSRLQLSPPDELDLPDQVGFCWTYWPIFSQGSLEGEGSQADVLVVLDDIVNYEAIKPLLPPAEPRFKVLLTTRLQLGRSVNQLEVDVLDEFAALELLKLLVGTERVQRELEDAKQLCAWLGYLPLGLELVGRYLARKPDLSLVDMHQRLKKKRLDERAIQKPEGDMTATLGVAAAFDLSWETLSEPAKQLGYVLSLFALATIPWTLVEQIVLDQDPDELEDIRDESLCSLHLVQRVGEGTYRLHQLIREFLQEKLEQSAQADGLKRTFSRAIAAISRQIPKDPTVEQIATFNPVIPHLMEVAKYLSGHTEEPDLETIFLGVGRFYKGQESYTEAESWFEHCLKVTKERFGSEHPLVVQLFNHLADVYHRQGRYAEAENLLLQTLELGKKQLGEEHIKVATSLCTLGWVYESQGRYAEAEQAYLQALEIRRKQLGDEHEDIAASLHYLAKFYLNRGYYAEAEPYFLEALAMRERLLGNEHPQILGTLSNLAKLYSKQGRVREAESILIRVLAMRKRLQGEEHLYVSFSQDLRNCHSEHQLNLDKCHRN